MKSEGISSSRPQNSPVSTKPPTGRAQSPQDKANALRERQDKDPLVQEEIAAGKIDASAIESKGGAEAEEHGNKLNETA